MQIRNAMLVITVTLVVVYIGAYYGLSRRGYAEADRVHSSGFYYFTPEDTEAWNIKNYACVVLFWPLNKVDRWLGYGRCYAKPPMFGLSLLESSVCPSSNG